MYYPVSDTYAISSDDEAVALPVPDQVGDLQSIYVMVANVESADVWVTSAGAEHPSAWRIQEGEGYMFGPVLGSDLARWGLYSEAEGTDNVQVQYLVGRTPSIDRGRFPGPFLQTPFTWTRVVEADDPS